MTTPPRRLAGVVTLVFLAACTVGGGGSGHRNQPVAAGSADANAVAIPHVTPGGAPTLQAAIAKLCAAPPQTHGKPAAGTLPPDLVSIAQAVEQARGHQYKRYPPATEVSNSQMDRRLLKNFRQTTSRPADDRRTVAWRTIGVIGPADDLYRAYRAFTTGQVVGYYDPETGDLVYLGSGSLDFSERFTLAHELTHALDDQTFDLTRLDPLTAHCQDERAQAALGLVEGSAQYFAAVAVAQNPQIDLADLLKEIADAATSGNPPPGVPQFVFDQQLWPYSTGEMFVASLVGSGGTTAVDHAFERFPVSTEQVIDPTMYPGDKPVPVSIPDIAGTLGPRWGDLDAMTIGEEWLRGMLALRDGVSPDAATGWSGGGYRAWTDGHDVVVVLRTRWDEPDRAATFASALQAWSAGRTPAPAVSQAGDQVTAVFATSAPLVATAQKALGQTG
ncbi:MAG TPA: hypothetical protein VHW68_04660 [Actinomycetota bacterium]|nr:hypothetical protein [Actinomycetota bacterium]